MIRLASLLLFVGFTLAGSVGQVWAQDPADDRGPRVSGVVGGANARSATDFTFAGSFGYRFDRFLGVEFEVTGMPELGERRPFDALARASLPSTGIRGAVPTILPIDRDGRGVFFTANFRSEIPTGVRWLIPYFTAGGGVASIRERLRIGGLAERQVFSLVQGQLPPGVQFSSGMRQSVLQTLTASIAAPRDLSNVTTDLALDLGGGVSFVVVKGLSLDADLRYYRVFSDAEFNVIRFGSGASYRF